MAVYATLAQRVDDPSCPVLFHLSQDNAAASFPPNVLIGGGGLAPVREPRALTGPGVEDVLARHRVAAARVQRLV